MYTHVTRLSLDSVKIMHFMFCVAIVTVYIYQHLLSSPTATSYRAIARLNSVAHHALSTLACTKLLVASVTV